MQNSDPKRARKKVRKLPPEIIALRSDEDLLGIKREELAQRLGVKVGTIHRVFSGNYDKPGLLHRVEIALGRRYWSTEEEFNKRMAEHEAEKKN